MYAIIKIMIKITPINIDEKEVLLSLFLLKKKKLF